MRQKSKLYIISLIFIPLFLSILSLKATYADDFYLKNGEILKGNLISIQTDVIVIQSEIGYGYVDIPKDQVLSIVFPDNNKIDLSRRYGIGYLNKSQTTNINDKYYYQVNQISFRTYVNTTFFFDFLFGYSSSNYKENETSDSIDFTVIQADFRASRVFYRKDQLISYLGLSLGAINWKDPTVSNEEETGLNVSLFLGSEIFFPSLPNLGFSGELSIRYQDSDSLTRYDITVTPIPALAVHYYF